MRDATAADASAIATIQITCWTHDYDWPPEIYTALEASDPEMQWARAVIAPPGPGYRLMVATHSSDVVGYAALAPSHDADAEAGEAQVVAWEVEPAHRRHGHGSRLLAAVADHARSIGAHSLSIWIASHDEPRRRLLTEAGFGPDGAHRTVQVDDGWGGDDVTMRQVRLSCAL